MGILTELWYGKDTRNVDGQYSYSEQHVHTKDTGKDGVQFLLIGPAGCGLPYSKDRYAHGGEEQEIIDGIVYEVDQTQLLYSQNSGDIGKCNQPYYVSGYCEYALVYKVGSDGT